MPSSFQQIIDLLVTSPGDLMFYLVVGFSTLFCLASIFTTPSNQERPGRMLVGFGLLFLALMMVFLLNGMAWLGVFDGLKVLPPLDRAFLASVFLVMVWMWAFPKPHRQADNAFIFLFLGVLILLAVTLVSWNLFPRNTVFNGSILDWIWLIAEFLIAASGLTILLLRRPPAWQFGAASLAILTLGLLAGMAGLNPEGYFSGTVRLAFLCAFPLLAVLPQRLRIPQAFVEPPAPPQPSPPDIRFNPVFDHLSQYLAAGASRELAAQGVVQALMETIPTDFCFLACLPNAQGGVAILTGRERSSNSPLPSFNFEKDQLPALRSAIAGGTALEMNKAGEFSPELKIIGLVFGLKNLGYLFSLPLVSRGTVWGSILLVSYSEKPAWQPETQLLIRSSATLAEILMISDIQPHENRELDFLRAELEQLRQENFRLASERPASDGSTERSLTDPDINTVLAVQQESQDLIASLQAENKMLLGELNQERQETSRWKTQAAMMRPETLAADSFLPADLVEMADQVVSDENVLIREKRLSIQIDIPEGLSPVKTYPSLLNQVMRTFLVIACESAPAQSRIRLTAGREESGSPPGLLFVLVSYPTVAILSAEVERSLEEISRLVEQKGGSMEISADPAGTAALKVRIPFSQESLGS